jgi:hypothetical protein
MAAIPMAEEMLAESIKVTRDNVIYKLNANKKIATCISFDESYTYINVLRHLTDELIKCGYNIREHREKDKTSKYYYIAWDRPAGGQIYTYC